MNTGEYWRLHLQANLKEGNDKLMILLTRVHLLFIIPPLSEGMIKIALLEGLVTVLSSEFVFHLLGEVTDIIPCSCLVGKENH